jgi:O-antigen ligase
MDRLWLSTGLAWVAVALPTLLVFNEPPSPTLTNQCVSIALTGCWMAVTGRAVRPLAAVRPPWTLLSALMAMIVAVGWSAASALPASLAIGSAAVLAVCAPTVWFGAVTARRPDATARYCDFASALCIAGFVSSIIAYIQVFAPSMADGVLVAQSSITGRAVGNLRQPNHLSSLILWALIAAIALLELGVLSRRASSVAFILSLIGLVLSGSRTGIIGVLLLAVWAMLDRKLSRSARVLLFSTPFAFAAIWVVVLSWAHATHHAFAGESRLSVGGGDISSSRFAIWSNTLSMIREEPLSGVGAGEFNLAWTLGDFPNRPIAFFDHTHNLPLQLFVELGIPLGSLVVALLLVALFAARRSAWSSPGGEGTAKRTAFMIVLMIGIHSLLEYPLWYAYFLLPTAFAWGFACAVPIGLSELKGNVEVGQGAQRSDAALAVYTCTLKLSGLAAVIGAAVALLDYHNVVVIYDPPDDAAPLEDRIIRGQRSPLFGHHADYAAATAFGPPKAPLSPSQELAFKRAPHQLLDVRLMIAWSQALAAQGDLDKARWLAARIREFRNPGADEYFAPCNDPAQAAQAFQCQAPTRVVHWREFTQR